MGRATRDGALDGHQIEFLAPREFAFGGEEPPDFVGFDGDDVPEPDDATPRSPWLTVAAALVVSGLIAGGVIAAAPWEPAAESAPTTVPSSSVPAPTAPSSTVPVPSTVAPGPAVVPAEPPTGFVFDVLPAGFAIRQATVLRGSGPGTSAPATGWGEVWATADASPTSGAWFSIAMLDGQVDAISQNGTRVDLGGRVGMLERLGDGTTILTAMMIEGDHPFRSLTIRSFGLTVDELITLFTSTGVDENRPPSSDDRPQFLDPSLVEAFHKVAGKSTDQDLLSTFVWGEPTSVTDYANGAGDMFITITASPRDDALEPLQRIAINSADTPLDPKIATDFPGEDLRIGSISADSDSMLIAKWHEGDTTITVTSSLPLDQLLQLLPTVRPTTAAEWVTIQQRVDDGQPAPEPTPGLRRQVVVASGRLADGAPWVVSVRAPSDLTVHTHGFALSRPPLDDSMPIVAWSTQKGTVVTAFVGTSSTAQTMVVTVGGQVLATVPLIDPGTIDPSSSFGGRVAATAFEQPGAYVVELLDAAGTVVDRFASPGADG